MLRKLRIKFVLIVMAVVVVMLGVVFAFLYASTSQGLERESVQMMERVAQDPAEESMPGKPPEDVRLPYFVVTVDANGNATEAEGGFFDLSDKEAIESLAQAAVASKEKTGMLDDYHLRYSRFETPLGERIVFADTTSEQTTLSNLIQTFALVGALALAAFLVIAILLARWAVKPVETAWKQQRRFVADASHELKTPLTVITTNAELLDEEACPGEEGRQFASNILTMSKQMRGLVESLLDLARIDDGSRARVRATVDMSETASDAAMMFEPIFFEKGLPFNYDVEPGVSMTGDAAQMKQLVDILLDNAAKYATPGGEVRLRLASASHKHCRLEVANQGEPIAAADLAKLFDRFYRADEARAMNQSYGLGLSIAKSICEEHRGRISAASADGWNIFRVELPVE